jgi:hypothetical protein
MNVHPGHTTAMSMRIALMKLAPSDASVNQVLQAMDSIVQVWTKVWGMNLALVYKEMHYFDHGGHYRPDRDCIC